MASQRYISFDEAVKVLKAELRYPNDKAIHFVKKFDRNKDGRLSVEEFTAFKKKIELTKSTLVPKFKEYDKDDNGYISLPEASEILSQDPFNFPPGKVLMLLHKFDKDGNGKLDIEEFADFYAEAKASHLDLAAKFDDLDKDGNGVLSPDEVCGAIQDMLGFDETTARWMVQMFDHNQDGSLDKGEFVEMWTSMFG